MNVFGIDCINVVYLHALPVPFYHLIRSMDYANLKPHLKVGFVCLDMENRAELTTIQAALLGLQYDLSCDRWVWLKIHRKLCVCATHIFSNS